MISLTSEVKEKTFELPPSWLLPLDINERDFETRLPKGKKSILYKKCRLDKFAPYTNSDALVGRLTLYGDISLSTQLEIREWYQFRMDKLQRRTRYVTSLKIKEEFGKGRPLRLKEHVYQENETGLEGTRTLEYYGKSRVDGLMCRELSKFSLVECFKGRDDFLVKRQVSYYSNISGVVTFLNCTILSLGRIRSYSAFRESPRVRSTSPSTPCLEANRRV